MLIAGLLCAQTTKDNPGLVGGRFNVFLRSSEMGDTAQQFGASMRFHAALPKPALETVIIVTALLDGAVRTVAHKRAALQAGVSPAIVDTITAGSWPVDMTPDVETAYNFIAELLKGRASGTAWC